MRQHIQNNWTFLIRQFAAHIRMPLYRNAYLLAISAAAVAALGAIYWVIAARFYAPEELGLDSAIVSTVVFLSGLAQLGLITVLNRFVSQTGHLTARFIVYCYLLTGVVSVVASLIFVIGQPIWSPQRSLIETNVASVMWFTLTVITWTIFTLQDGVLAGLRNAVWVPVENISSGLLRIVLLILFAVSIPHYGIFASWSIPILLTLIPVNYLIFRKLIPAHVQLHEAEVPLPRLRHIAAFAASNYVGTLFSVFSTLLLPIIVVARAGTEANAYFYAVWVIRGSLDMIPTNMTFSLTTEGAMDLANLPIYMRKITIQSLGMLLPIVIFLCVAAPLVLSIFGTAYSEGGTLLLRLVVLAVIPKTFILLYLGAARVLHQPKRIVAVQAILCVLILSLSISLLEQQGITGIGTAWLLSHTIVAAALLILQLRAKTYRTT